MAEHLLFGQNHHHHHDAAGCLCRAYSEVSSSSAATNGVKPHPGRANGALPASTSPSTPGKGLVGALHGGRSLLPVGGVADGMEAQRGHVPVRVGVASSRGGRGQRHQRQPQGFLKTVSIIDTLSELAHGPEVSRLVHEEPRPLAPPAAPSSSSSSCPGHPPPNPPPSSSCSASSSSSCSSSNQPPSHPPHPTLSSPAHLPPPSSSSAVAHGLPHPPGSASRFLGGAGGVPGSASHPTAATTVTPAGGHMPPPLQPAGATPLLLPPVLSPDFRQYSEKIYDAVTSSSCGSPSGVIGRAAGGLAGGMGLGGVGMGVGMGVVGMGGGVPERGAGRGMERAFERRRGPPRVSERVGGRTAAAPPRSEWGRADRPRGPEGTREHERRRRDEAAERERVAGRDQRRVAKEAEWAGSRRSERERGTERGRTPDWIKRIFDIAKKGDLQALKRCLAGMDTSLVRNLSDRRGNNLLHVMAVYGHLPPLRFLLASHRPLLDALHDENQAGLTPLVCAVKNQAGLTPLVCAVKEKKENQQEETQNQQKDKQNQQEDQQNQQEETQNQQEKRQSQQEEQQNKQDDQQNQQEKKHNQQQETQNQQEDKHNQQEKKHNQQEETQNQQED
ncbi:translation initiation factor IF-2-like [Penaeus japonicus]|uniref:translation initiation factor IF-2-like n=1 Tax=Penaeus japonicus TaxID=27405 RepID=UPI001C711F3C|nr:translation initiation factor IF-2-like [Penaeus japonicus]